jgi:hypothetical protein
VWRGFLNYVHQEGGWKGKKPDWDTSAPVDVGNRYDAQRRAQANAETEEMIQRIRSMIVNANEEAYWDISDAHGGSTMTMTTQRGGMTTNDAQDSL